MIVENSRFVALLDAAGRRVEAIVESSRANRALRGAADRFTALPQRQQIRCCLSAIVVAIATYFPILAALPEHAAPIAPLAAGVLFAIGCAASAPFRK